MARLVGTGKNCWLRGSVANAWQLVQDGNGGSGSWWGMAGSGRKWGNGGNGGNGGYMLAESKGGMVEMVRNCRDCLALAGKGGMVKMAGFWTGGSGAKWSVVMRSGGQ